MASNSENLIGVTFVSIFASIVVVALLLLTFAVFKQRELQPLKIKSPRLLIITLVANILFVVLMSLIEINAEVCTKRACNQGLVDTARVSGYLLVCYVEPLLLISYTFRYLRIKRIFDAQQQYFETQQRPSDMIKRYSEYSLITICLITCGIITGVYMAIGASTWGAKHQDGYGYLPSFALAADAENQHTTISLVFFVVMVLTEGAVFAYFLDQVKEIKREFSMLTELQLFTGIWIGLTDLTLFILIQGIASQWFSEITYYRVAFTLLVLRSVLVALVSSVKPLWETRRRDDEEAGLFFPIPPNRECIESVDMVLHIPIAVDYFYAYLQSRHEQLKDKEAIHLIALYIDLRLYDKAFSEDTDREYRRELAIEIYEQYLSEDAMNKRKSENEVIEQLAAQHQSGRSYFPVQLDSNVKTLFDHKYIDIENNLNEYLFIEVYAFVLDKLREYFSFFKSSQAFVQLEDEITKQERLYEVLVEANLIEIQ